MLNKFIGPSLLHMTQWAVPRERTACALEHLDAVNVDLVTVDVSSDGDVMAVMFL